jgi:hypothetical protein
MSTISSAVETAAGISQPAQHQRHLLGSRILDFWMLGGLSLLLWLPLYLLLNQSATLVSLGLALPAVALTLAYAVNHPHFMASYKLAYAQGRSFILLNWVQLLAVPVVMLGLLVIAYLYWEAPISGSAVMHSVNALLEGLGLKTRIGNYPNLGSEILSYFVHFMYFTVGWHYSKQTFGCMMVYAKFDSYPLSTLHRNLIRYGLLSTWWVSWLYSHCSEGSFPFYGLTVYRLNLPYVWFQISYVLAGLLFAAIIILFGMRYLSDRRLPSLNFLVPMVALLTWHVPLFGQPQFFVVIALFHSLQYFPFVAKVEATRYRKTGNARGGLRLLGFFGAMAGVGYLAFYFVPESLDAVSKSLSYTGLPFFVMAIVLFINIHHYFIDNVLWRFKNKEVRDLLFG